jgi:hypothetical protein
MPSPLSIRLERARAPVTSTHVLRPARFGKPPSWWRHPLARPDASIVRLRDLKRCRAMPWHLPLARQLARTSAPFQLTIRSRRPSTCRHRRARLMRQVVAVAVNPRQPRKRTGDQSRWFLPIAAGHLRPSPHRLRTSDSASASSRTARQATSNKHVQARGCRLSR